MWQKSEEIYHKSNGKDKNDARDPWITCPTCHQPYTGHLKLELAKFYIEKTQSFPDNDCRRLFATLNLAETKATEFGDYAGGIDQLEQVLAAIQCSSRSPPEEFDYFNQLAPEMEVECLEGLGMAYGDLGDESKSLFYLEKAHKLALEVYDPSHPLLKLIESSLSCKPKSDGTSSIVASLRERLEECRKHFGENHDSTITGMIALSEELVRHGEVSEAVDLAKNAFGSAKQSLGPDHETTKMAEKGLKQSRAMLESNKVQAAIMAGEAKPAKLLSSDPSLDGKTVFILRPVKNDAKKYICAMLDDGGKQIKKVKILLSKLILKKGTPVQCRDMISASHLNGKRGAVQSFDDKDGSCIKSYEVFFDDERIPPMQIKIDNLIVVLD